MGSVGVSCRTRSLRLESGPLRSPPLGGYTRATMADRELVEIARTLNWDTTCDPEELAEVLSGERERVGHFDREALFARMLATFPWHRTVAVLGIEVVEELLTPEVIAKLWPPSLRERHERIRRLLRGDPVPPAEWGPELRRRLRSTLLSDRWYGAP